MAGSQDFAADPRNAHVEAGVGVAGPTLAHAAGAHVEAGVGISGAADAAAGRRHVVVHAHALAVHGR